MTKPYVLNYGCGADFEGHVRADTVKTVAVTHVINDEAFLRRFTGYTFTRVLMRNVLEHLPDPGRVLRDIHACMAPRGEIEIVTDNAHYLGYAFNHHEYVNGKGQTEHYALYNETHLRALLEYAGFDVESVQLFTKWNQSIPGRILSFVFPLMGHANWKVIARAHMNQLPSLEEQSQWS